MYIQQQVIMQEVENEVWWYTAMHTLRKQCIPYTKQLHTLHYYKKQLHTILQNNVHNQKLYSNFKHQLLETANGLQCTWNCDCTSLQNDTMQYIQSLLIYPLFSTSRHVEKGYKYISMISVNREEMYFLYTLVWRKQLGSFYIAFRIL